MKKTICLAAGILMAVLLMLSATQTQAQKSEEEAIKKVLNQETLDFFNKNYEAWATHWLHDSSAFISMAGPAGYRQYIGWNAISTQYKQDIQNLDVRSEAEIAPFLNKTDYHIYINGNMATANFKEGNEDSWTETRTMVKQKGGWKILTLTMVNSNKYNVSRIIESMKTFVGKWVLDGTPKREPTNSSILNSVEFELWETPTGLEQTSKFMVTNSKGITNAGPTAYEYFIPDYNTNKIIYLGVSQNYAGQTYTEGGTITSDKPNSFTVTTYYQNKPGFIETQYTVTLQNGKWHQVGNFFDKSGKLKTTVTMDLRRI